MDDTVRTDAPAEPASADGETPVLVASALEVRSAVRVRQSQVRAAIEDARRAVAMREKIAGPRHPSTAGALPRPGQALLADDRAAQAEAALARAAEMLG